jgi:large subunit ribosomal protein L21
VTYAIIKVAGKQYRVREGERLLVDRLAEEDGATFTPTVLLVGGNGDTALEPDVKVTAKVVGAVKGPKIRIGKYKKRTGYRRHTGFRASLTQIEIESIGAKRKAAKKEEPAAEKEKAKTPAAEAKAEEPQAERVKGMPADYENLTVAAIKEASTEWNRPMLEAALEYERENANRKGAIAALESALAAKEGDS